MSEQNEIRKQVSEDYAKAVTRPKGAGACCGGDANVGALAKAAGYDSEALADMPEDAVTNAFGCGNPVAFTNVAEGETVLDLGSGAGIDLLFAAKKVGPTGHVIGVDMTDEMITAAEANIKKAGATNIEVRKGIIEALPVEDASVDWVISNCVINLSPEKEKVFAEISRVLRPGGRMLVSDIVADELPEAVRKSAALYSSCLGGAISETNYLAGLREAGLEEVEVVDRIVYKSKQLQDLAGDAPAEVTGCCGSGGDLSELAGSVEGKVWSAEFSARKPK